MKTQSKAMGLIALLLIVGGGFIVLNSKNSPLLKGLLMRGIGEEVPVSSDSDGLLPDLKPSLKALVPEAPGVDLQVEAEIRNIGPGEISGQTPFKYTIYINDIEVFSNTDSYSAVAPGEAFSFVYPISRPIYEYPDVGTLKFVLDTEDAVKENNEDNNETEINYDLGAV